MTWITALEVTGTAVFAMSGVFTAQDCKLDWVGTLTVVFRVKKESSSSLLSEAKD